jgi:GNAT superfamily N-acetyltransferase
MAAYRFCRTDDIGLLVEALNRCWAPYFPDEPAVTAASFKRSIRDLQVWCSSCMVAFSGVDPIGVLIGAKRASGTLIHRIAVHPDHRRQGHGRHLLASLGSKLAILGPPRMIAEVPDALAPARELFGANEYVQEALLTDYVLPGEESDDEREVEWVTGDGDDRFVIPITVDDLAANGLLGEGYPHVCWERSVETLTARKDEIAGLGIASGERIEAYVLYVKQEIIPEGNAGAGSRASARTAAIVALRCFVDDGGTRLKHLLFEMRARGIGTSRFSKVRPDEISKERLETLGFRAAGGHLLYAATPRSE